MAAGTPRQVNLLRGINVGGHHKVPMKWLREAYDALGCEDVTTYLQSGNVVFHRDNAPTAVSAELAAVIKKELGFDIDVLDRTHDDLVRLVADDQFPAADPSKRLVVFLSRKLTAAEVRSLERLVTGQEALVVGTRELQLHCTYGIGRSKLAEAVSKKQLKLVATARNWRTVTKLVELSAPVDG